MSKDPKRSRNAAARNGAGVLKGVVRKEVFPPASIHTMDTAEKISLIRNGVTKQYLEEIKDQSGLDYDSLSAILAVSRATLINKKGLEKFDTATSERILLFADTLAYGQSVFEDSDRFNVWMKSSNKALGNKTPIEMMDTLYGMQEVKKLIGRIEYGVF